MNNLAIIQARMGSTRLPGKVLMDLYGKTVLERVIERVNRSKLISTVLVATSIDKNNLPMVKLCADNNIQVFCGSEDDVLDRFYQAARLLKPDNVVRITADCPLIDPKIIDMVIKSHIETKADYSSNVLKETYPDGLDIEIFTFEKLAKVWQKAHKKSYREHVTLYMRENPELFRLNSIENDESLGHLRWTLDQPEDYEFIKRIYSYFQSPDFGMDEILDVLKKDPSLLNINQNIVRNEGLIISKREEKDK